MLLYFKDQAAPATALARSSGLTGACIERHQFPDGEVKLRLPAQLPEKVVIYRSLDRPNEKLVELLLAAQSARRLGARHLTLVAPYLAYMRQDMEFSPGEAVSQSIVGHFLAGLFDAAITVDPHLHRISTLQQAMPLPHAMVLTGAHALADLVVERRDRPLLVGPDAESAQWVALAAARHGLDHVVCSKVRHGDRAVEVTLGQAAVAGRPVVIMDDVISTGHTVAAAARLLKAAGAASIDVAVTHALFVADALQTIRDAGVNEVWSTDCVSHFTNTVHMAELFARTLAGIHAAANQNAG